MSDDPVLLRRFVREGDHDAFAALVQRHFDLVYSVAMRQVGGDVHLAKDAAQIVFAALARKAASLADRATLGGWLYRAAQFAAIDVVRAERRRRGYEQEAVAMKEISGERRDEVDWERVRPLLDRAIGELNEVDRDAVVMRFIHGCSFADVGGRLRLTENAARMRVERALGKLHASLAKRGVRSTAAAMAAAIAAPSGIAAPAGLAAEIASGVLTAIPVAGAGAIAVVATWKIATVVASVAAAAATGMVAMQRRELREVETARMNAQRQAQAAQSKIADVNAQLVHAERRADEAERDNGALLKAVEAVRVQQAAETARRIARAVTEDERVVHERAYQQELARRHAQEAKARAKIDTEVAQLDPTRRYERLLEVARQHLADGSLQTAVRTFNQAMTNKPRDIALSPTVQELQAALAGQNVPVELMLSSDGKTFVSIQGARSPTRFSTTTLKVLPGNYEIVGRRSGFVDVVIPVQVRNGAQLPALRVVCTMPK